MAVVALTHPQEAPLQMDQAFYITALDCQCPACRFTRPFGGLDLVAITDVRPKIGILDSPAQIVQNLLARSDGITLPRLEAIAESEQIAVRTGAGILVHQPGAAERFHRVEDNKAQVRAVLAQQGCAADARDPRADDYNVETLDLF